MVYSFQIKTIFNALAESFKTLDISIVQEGNTK